VRLEIKKIDVIKSGDNIIGSRVRVKVVKNKVAPPFKQAEFDLMYDTGISREGCLIDVGLEYKLIEKSGTWFTYGNERLGQGRENAKMFLKENENIAKELEKKIREVLGLTS
jgi:recombination protein RecA